MILILVVMFAFMYFGMMRPQKKQQQKRQEMLGGMKKGDKVVTIGGLHGMIDSINRDKGTVDLDLDGIYLTFNLSAIRTVNGDNPTAPEAKKTGVKPTVKPAAKKPEAAKDDKPYSEAKDEHSSEDK